MSKKVLLPIIYLVLFGVSFVGSYFIYRAIKSPASSTPSPVVTSNGTPVVPTKKPKVDPSLPKTAVCPLNGSMFTELEKAAWSKRRPLAVMIENSVDARPQSGLSTADVVYEAVAEGGITRFMGLFYCDAALAGNITLAPVRSARIYFVNLVSEYDALYTHVGGAGNCDDPNVDSRAKALCAIQKYNIKDLDEMGRAGDFKTCHRLANRLDHEVAYEHTMACFMDELYKVGEKWGWTNVDDKTGIAWDKNFVSWKFLADGKKATGSPATNISYGFWETNPDFNSKFNVSWAYDAKSDSYARSNGGTASVDLNTGEPLKYKTVVVEFAKETFIDDVEKHMLYDVIGTGKAIVFENGVAINGTWSKATRTSRTVYYDSAGKQILLNPGPIWISIVPSGNQVNYN